MIIFKNQFNEFKRSPIGFSFTMLIFGFFVPLLRKDFKWAGIQFATQLSYLIHPALGLTSLVLPFMYNKLYIKDLLEQGYYPVDNNQAKLIVSYNVVSLEEMRGYKARNLIVNTGEEI